jgi:hypothetical protein
MKRTNNNNWIFTISIILTAIVLAFLSFIPINIEYIKPFVVYFDPTKLLSNLPLWIFINSIIALYSHSEKTSMLNTTLFNIICFASYCLFSKILAHAMPKEMFLTWIVFTLIWAIFAYLVWSANRKDTKGWILSTILLAILFSTCFTYTENTISSTTILNFLLYVFLVVILYKGTKETLIIVVLSILLAMILNKFQIQIIFTKSACIYFNSVLL